MTTGYPVWGWARNADDAPTSASLRDLVPLVREHLGLPVTDPETPADLPTLPPDRVSARLPRTLLDIANDDPFDRARHSLGRSYRDVVRGIRGQLDHVVDLVLRPRSEDDVVAALDWCADAGVAVSRMEAGPASSEVSSRS
jgi:alkyldihydroxyacetonephosphate synthase